MKNLTKIATLALFSLATMASAAAQADVNPDHFPDLPSAAAPTVTAEAQTQINALETRIQDCEARMQQQSEMLEKARQEVISAGIQGDGAGDLMSSYQAEEQRVGRMQKALDTEIASAKRDLDMLKAEGSVVVAAGTRKPTPRASKATGPVLVSVRGDMTLAHK